MFSEAVSFLSLGKDTVVLYDGIALPERSAKEKVKSFVYDSSLVKYAKEEMRNGCQTMLPDWKFELQNGMSIAELLDIIKSVQKRQKLVATGFSAYLQQPAQERIDVNEVINIFVLLMLFDQDL